MFTNAIVRPALALDVVLGFNSTTQWGMKELSFFVVVVFQLNVQLSNIPQTY
jgi:hypothetical protein